MMNEDTYQHTILTVLAAYFPDTQVAIDDNFFDLGADSLVAIRACGALSDLLGIRLGIEHIFEFPTVRELAAAVASGQCADAPLPEIMPLPRV